MNPNNFWHDACEIYDKEYSGAHIFKGNKVNFQVKFTTDQFLNSSHTKDLSQASKSDEDGVIEIDTDNDDGDEDIADNMKENIKMAADLIRMD